MRTITYVGAASTLRIPQDVRVSKFEPVLQHHISMLVEPTRFANESQIVFGPHDFVPTQNFNLIARRQAQLVNDKLAQHVNTDLG